jgi:hypothetical protein
MMRTARPTTLRGWGITAAVPGQWEGRLYNRPAPTADFDSAVRAQTEAEPGRRSLLPSGPYAKAGGIGWKGERTAPVLHLANFVLGSERGDFGSGTVGTMGPRHAFVSLLEYDRELAGTALFSPQGMPRPRRADFSPDCLQRRLPGQLGFQRFFTAGSRAFCLFVVLGSAGRAATLVDDVNDTLGGVGMTP